MNKEYIEEHIVGPYTFECRFCHSTKIKRRIMHYRFGPPSDLSVCDQCGCANWVIKEKA